MAIGSRSAERGAAAAAEIAAMLGERASQRTPASEERSEPRSEATIGHATLGEVVGATNADASQLADVVIVAVPWEGHAETVASLRAVLAGKIVVDCVNPLGFDAKGPYALRVPEGSAAEQTESLLPSSRVCAAFHHVSSVLLANPAVDRIELDVLVLGDDRDAVSVVVALAGRIDGMRGIYAGRLRNAAQVEALTANLIAINRRYKAHSGLRVTAV